MDIRNWIKEQMPNLYDETNIELDDVVQAISSYTQALQLQQTDVVKCNCKIPHPQMKVSENGISGYCAKCIKPL